MKNVSKKRFVNSLIKVLFIIVTLNIPVIIQVEKTGGLIGYSLWNVDRDKALVLAIALLLGVLLELFGYYKGNGIICILLLSYVLKILKHATVYAEKYTNINRTMIINYLTYFILAGYIIFVVYSCCKKMAIKDIGFPMQKGRNYKTAVAISLCAIIICCTKTGVSIVNAYSDDEKSSEVSQCSQSKEYMHIKDKDGIQKAYKGEKILITFVVDNDELENCIFRYEESEGVRFSAENDQEMLKGEYDINIELEVLNEGEKEIKFILMEASDNEVIQCIYVYTYSVEGMTFLSLASVDDAENAYYDWLLENSKIDFEEYNYIQEEKVKLTEENADIEINFASSKLRAANSKITLSGTIKWTDVNGATHAANEIRVEIWDRDTNTDELLTSVYTDSNGKYSVTIDNDTSALEMGYDIYIKLCARGRYVSVVDTSGNIYSRTLDLGNNLSAGQLTANITINNSNDINRAFQVQQAGSMASAYVRQQTGSYLENLKIYYPSSNSTYYSNNTIRLLAGDYCDWDVIQHEYGHHVGAKLGIANSPGGSHSSDQNLADARENKSAGIRLAWSEGWSTYFAISVQEYHNASKLNIPNVGDYSYTDTIDSEISYSIESFSSKWGEANERAVAAVLLDLADGTNENHDKLSLGYASLFSTVVNNKCTTLSALLAKIQGIINTRDLYIGEILSNAGVSSALSSPSNGMKLTTSLPTFTWIKRGGSSLYPNNSFSLVFYNYAYEKICEISVGNVSSYKLTSSEWSKICNATKNSKIIYWTIKASQTSSPSTGPYFSNYRYFYIP